MFDPAAFDKAFVATAYLLGARDDALVEALPDVSAEAVRLRLRLADTDRQQRAVTLAPALARLVSALEAGRFS